MAVYVDDMHLSEMGEFKRMKMCHMTADTHEELMEMAAKLGLNPKWLQHKGTWKEHFDVAKGKRAEAVKLGAIEITMRETVSKAKARFQK